MQKKNRVKTMVNFRFISLLSIAFFLQHFSFAGLQNNIGLNNLNAGIVQNNYFEQDSTKQQGSILEIFAEVADEDEDEVHNEQNFCPVFNFSSQISNAEHYSNAINTLYLSLASSNQHKVDLPFFILFHSWKSDLA
jgi:hypothetical protein